MLRSIVGDFVVYDHAGAGTIATLRIGLIEPAQSGSAPSVTMDASDGRGQPAFQGEVSGRPVQVLTMTRCDLALPMVVAQDGDQSTGSVRCWGPASVWYTVVIAPLDAMVRYPGHRPVHSPTGLFLVTEGVATPQTVYGLAKYADKPSSATR